MPLADKGKKVLSAMREHYGEEKGRQVFYASVNKGTIRGAERKRRKRGPLEEAQHRARG